MKKNIFFYEQNKETYNTDYLKDLFEILKKIPLKELSTLAILIGSTVLIYYFFFQIHFLPYLDTNEIISLSLIIFFGVFIYIFIIAYLFIFGNEFLFEALNKSIFSKIKIKIKDVIILILASFAELIIIFTIYKSIYLFVNINPLLVIGGIISSFILYQIAKIKKQIKELQIIIVMTIIVSLYFSLPQLSNRLTNFLKLGNFRASLIIQNPYICKDIKQIDNSTQVYDNKMCEAKLVYVLWRGGKSTIIQVSDNQNYKEDFVIKQQDIKSFSILEN